MPHRLRPPAGRRNALINREKTATAGGRTAGRAYRRGHCRDAPGNSCRSAAAAPVASAAGLAALSIVVSAAAIAFSASAADATVQLRPHRAVYEMSLAAPTRPSDVVGATGKMFYRFARTCDGWVVENRTLLRLNLGTDRDIDSVWTFASWESFDGAAFRFHARYEQNGQTIERLDGTADRAADSSGGEAHFTQPDEQRLALPPGTVFPSEHVRLMIEAASTGARSLAKTVFDGASLDNPYFVHAIIGPLAPPERDALAKAAGLPPAPSWRTKMAYFPVSARSELPEFEISAHYRDDGIADVITQMFDTYGLNVRLIELEVLPAPDC